MGLKTVFVLKSAKGGDRSCSRTFKLSKDELNFQFELRFSKISDELTLNESGKAGTSDMTYNRHVSTRMRLI